MLYNLHLLEAELAVLNGNSYVAEDSYKLAITVAEKNGLIQDLALSHELASIGDDSHREYHMKNAIKCYFEWGATKKVRQLKDDLLIEKMKLT